MADQLATPEELASLMQQDLDLASADLVLNMATARVQRAAGGQRILDVTDTALLHVDTWEWDPYLELVQFPVRSVSAVLIDGVAVTDWSLRNQKLWRSLGWRGSNTAPAEVRVTSAHGYLAGSQYLEFARDCTLSLAQLGYGNPSAATSEAIDDYKVTFEEASARMVMTEPMRQAIADAYGATAYVTTSR